jgi:hypothetical protein
LWKATPRQQRSRALVLNRAIVDLGDPRFATRAARDLSEYLVAHPAPDELATNILAAALNNSASDAKTKRGEAWQSAWKEWSRRNEELDKSRAGYRRWGAEWLSDEQYAARRRRQKDLEDQIAQQAEAVDADLRRVGALAQAMSVREFIEDAGEFTVGQTNTVNPWLESGAYESEHESVQNLNHFYEVNAISNRAKAEAQGDMTRLQQLLMQRERPRWPKRFEPVEPSTEVSR